MFLLRAGGGPKGHGTVQTIADDVAQVNAKGPLMMFPHEGGAYYFMNTGLPEADLIAWVKQTFIRPDKVFLDIGAHIGSYTFSCAAGAKHTYAFECGPKTFCCLAANIGIHGLESKVTAFPYALGPSEGEATYYVRSGDGGGNGLKVIEEADNRREKVTVPMRPLDSFKIRDVGFIKLDVEGFEREVLEGAVETLRSSDWPPILFECWKDAAQAHIMTALFSFLDRLGYRVIEVKHAHSMWLAEYRR